VTGVKRFEELIAWQKARELTRDVFALTDQPALARKYGLIDQIERDSVSIMSNVAEGFERGSAAEFHQFLFVAKASCAEVRSLLYVLLDAGYVDETVFVRMRTQADEVGKVIGGLRAAVGRQRDAKGRGRAT
jgi:four helix bundle protein